MIAILILGALAGYLAAGALATVATLRWARRKEFPPIKRRLCAAAVALGFYLIPFWDLLPTFIGHRYYCATQATFESSKTVDQWIKENPEAVRTLKPISPPQFIKVGEYIRMPINERLAVERKELVPMLPAVRREEARIIDMKSAQVLAHYVDFLTGYGSFAAGGEGAWKFWLDMGACSSRIGHRAEFGDYQRALIRQLQGDNK